MQSTMTLVSMEALDLPSEDLTICGILPLPHNTHKHTHTTILLPHLLYYTYLCHNNPNLNCLPWLGMAGPVVALNVLEVPLVVFGKEQCWADVSVPPLPGMEAPRCKGP